MPFSAILVFATAVVTPVADDPYLAAAAHLIGSEPRPVYCLSINGKTPDAPVLRKLEGILAARLRVATPLVRPPGECSDIPEQSMEATRHVSSGRPARLLKLRGLRQVAPNRAELTVHWHQGPLDAAVLIYVLSVTKHGIWRVVGSKLIARS